MTDTIIDYATPVVFETPIEVAEGNEFNRYSFVKALKTFKHKDYCCPFCSHGETIQLKVFSQYNGNLMGSYKKAYLECSEKCMQYGIFEKSFLKGYTEEEKIDSIIKSALDIFAKIILFTKDRTEFIMV